MFMVRAVCLAHGHTWSPVFSFSPWAPARKSDGFKGYCYIIVWWGETGGREHQLCHMVLSDLPDQRTLLRFTRQRFCWGSDEVFSDARKLILQQLVKLGFLDEAPQDKQPIGFRHDD